MELPVEPTPFAPWDDVSPGGSGWRGQPLLQESEFVPTLHRSSHERHGQAR